MSFIIDLIRNNGVITFQTTLQAIVYVTMQILGLLFVVAYFHQFIYCIVGSCVKVKPAITNPTQHKLGIVIAAKDESKVIGNLIDSIHNTTYDADLVNIFVVADNCTDNTAEVCKEKGCFVFERQDKEHIGKGYALNFLFNELHTNEKYKGMLPDAYIIMDADNIMDKNFITEINKVYDAGYEMITSYRNSTNFGDNWISSGYGYWFLHESRHLNNSRMLMGHTSTILGTGFLISQKLVKEFNNWDFHMLTEDVESTMEYACRGGKIGYCHTAKFYDEQPTKFKQSWKQRERWAKGYFQAIKKYTVPLLKKSLTSFSAWDVFTNIGGALYISAGMIIASVIFLFVSLIMWDMTALLCLVAQLGFALGGMLIVMFLLALLLCITEWKEINTKWYKKILYTFTFPIFMLTYLPITVGAVFRYKKIGWSTIEHKGK